MDEIIEEMKFFIDNHPTFDGATMDALIGVYEEKGALTDRQEEAIRNVHQKWHVHEFCQKKSKIVPFS